MFIKYIPKSERFKVEDFGLKSSDKDAHVPSFYIIRKSRESSHKDRHQRSAESRQRGDQRRKDERREKTQLQWQQQKRTRSDACM